MAKSDGKRPDRVGERIREELMGLILRGAVHDPAVSEVVVSAVKVTEDLGMARVYVRTLRPAAPHEQAAVLEGLRRAGGFLRREVGRALGSLERCEAAGVESLQPPARTLVGAAVRRAEGVVGRRLEEAGQHGARFELRQLPGLRVADRRDERAIGVEAQRL